MNDRFAHRGRLRWPAMGAVAALSAVGVALPGGLVPAAGADPLGNAQAQAGALAQKITTEQTLVDQLSEQYDGARLHFSQLQAQVGSARVAFDRADAEARQVSAVVVQEAVQEYTAGGFSPPTAPRSGSADPVIAESYFALATNSQNDALDQLRQTRQLLSTQQAILARAEAASSAALTAVNSHRQQVAQAQADAQATLSSVQGQIAGLVAAAEARQQAAAQAALQAQYNAVLLRQLAQARTTAAASTGSAGTGSAGTGSAATGSAATGSAGTGSGLAPASTAAAASSRTPGPPAPTQPAPRPIAAANPATNRAASTQPAPIPTAAAKPVPVPPAPQPAPTAAPVRTAPPAPPTTTPAPPPAPVTVGASGAAATALRVALAQVGKPYQFGAAGPGSFDCSGLVQFAYAAAGVYLPHYTVAQWDDTTHIPLGALQPGDLIFFYGDFHHVGIYLGNGMMVDAPHTGADVRVESIAWFGPIADTSRVG